MAKYFQPYEYTCKCGCGFDDLHPLLLEKLDCLREYLGRPVEITSGCRCRNHDINVGGSGRGFHTKGMACDIYVAGMTMDELADICTFMGFDGVERNDSFNTYVHVDIRCEQGYSKYYWRYDYYNGERQCDERGNIL